MSVTKKLNAIADFRLLNDKINQTITLVGWVDRIHNLGGQVFIDLRLDGIKIQTVWDKKPENLQVEYIIEVTGLLQERPDNQKRDIYLGNLEIIVNNYSVISKSATLPFALNSDINIDNQLKYRILYLRRNSMQERLKLRHKIILFLRNKMDSLGFTEVQTPLLTSSSPEGARDFLVLSTKRNKNLKDAKWYALPQSPQMFKQMLMATGLTKYFQIAPCFRDEDARADRHTGEFYQLDFEMHFPTQEQILNLLDHLVESVINKFNPKTIIRKTLSYQEAMEQYGTDKPDIRLPIIEDLSEQLIHTECNIFQKILKNNGKIKSLMLPIKYKDLLLKKAEKLGFAVGYIYKYKGKYNGSLHKFLPDNLVADDHIRIFIGGNSVESSIKLHNLIKDIIPVNNQQYSLVKVINFPMFERDGDNLIFMHNPFSYSKGDDPAAMSADQYDLVLDGRELASGSIREIRPDVLERNLGIAGYTKEEIDKNFSSLLKNFQYGVPPHGGAAIGIERLLMTIQEASLYDVIAFPLSSQGRCYTMNCPKKIDIQKMR